MSLVKKKTYEGLKSVLAEEISLYNDPYLEFISPNITDKINI